MMVNFREGFEIKGAKELGLTTNHISACMHDRNKCSKPDYDYFGTVASSGSVIVTTKIGSVRVRFKEEHAWVQEASVELV